MNEEFPDEGQAGEIRDPEAERAVWPAPPPSGTTPSPAPAPGPVSAELPPTGDDRVDAAVAGLRRLPALPPDEHVAVLEEVHGRLRDILGELSEDSS
jgi:hypothetical protein